MEKMTTQSNNDKSITNRNEGYTLLENGDNLKQPRPKTYSKTYLPWSLLNSFCCCLCFWR